MTEVKFEKAPSTPLELAQHWRAEANSLANDPFPVDRDNYQTIAATLRECADELDRLLNKGV